MAEFYIANNTGVGYVVRRLQSDGNGWYSCDSIRNFGYRQTDAIEFRNDCSNGKIEPKRIEQLIKTYTDQPYKYIGKGNVRKNKEEY